MDCKTILVHNVQGLGDQIQFARYIFLLSNTYPDLEIHYFIDKKLVQLIDFNNTNVTSLSNITDISIYDFRIELLSVFSILKIDKITPFKNPSYIIEDEKKTQLWKDTLDNTCKKKLKVAICWKGLNHNLEKYIPLRLFKSISSLDLDIISIQCGDGSEETSLSGLMY